MRGHLAESPGGWSQMDGGLSASLRMRRESLRHENPRRARRVTGDATELLPAVALVKSRRLKADRIEHRGTTTSPHALFLSQRKHAGAEPTAAQNLGQEDEFDEHKAERGAAEQPTEDPPARGIAHQHGKRPRIPISCLLYTVPGEPVVDEASRIDAGAIGEDKIGFDHRQYLIHSKLELSGFLQERS